MGVKVDTPCSVTSEQHVCDLLHDAAVICDVDPIVTDLSITMLLCQIVADVVGTVQLQNGLGLVRGRGNQDLVTHVVLFEL